MEEAAAGFKRWQVAAGNGDRRPDLEEQFFDALSDDLDTPGAVGVLDDVAAAGAGGSLVRLAPVLGFNLQ